ncbi:MAG: EAL domain-containing protein, partial [Gemmatimonadaceae bacterium]
QPIVSAETGQLDAFETLLRWRHPSRGLQSPDEFLQSLEDAGMMVQVGEWMIRQIAAQMSVWKEKTGRMIPVTINLTSEQIESTPVFDALVDAMSGPEDLPILIEVSEDTLLRNTESMVSVLAPLRERGVRVVLDGFGTGICCLGYLAGLPVDAIKLDASFAESLARYSSEESTLHQIIGLAHRLDLDVIGSMIERPEQLADVADLCDEVQGYLISRPVDAVTATAMVESEWSSPLGPLAMPGPVS